MTEDRWAAWLRRRRSGGDEAFEAQTMAELAKARERILENAALQAGETLLDVGCGNGLIAFGALEREAGRVVFADVSQPLLDESRAIATALGLVERCEFVNAPADDLGSIESCSVDVVTTRSVLIYVEDKAAAFAEFFRVLRPGGRISLFEPINSFGMEERRREFLALDVPGLETAGAKLDGLFRELQPLSDPMLDFDERDLVREAEAAGFFPVRADVRLVVEQPEPRSWEGFLDTAGNPKIPTFREAMEQMLTPDEAARFVEHARPRVEQGLGRWRMGSLYLWATRPG